MSDAGAGMRGRGAAALTPLAEWVAAFVLVGWIVGCFVTLWRALGSGAVDGGAHRGTPVLAAGLLVTPAVALLSPLLLRWWGAERRAAARGLATRARLAVCALAWLAASLLAGWVWGFLVLEVIYA